MIDIGFWRLTADEDSTLPFPEPGEMTPDEKTLILGSLGRAEVLAAFRGFSSCRICGALNGTCDMSLTVGGKTFRFPEGLEHYVREHNVRPDEAFIAACKEQ